jgi:hypothetical protein
VAAYLVGELGVDFLSGQFLVGFAHSVGLFPVSNRYEDVALVPGMQTRA